MQNKEKEGPQDSIEASTPNSLELVNFQVKNLLEKSSFPLHLRFKLR